MEHLQAITGKENEEIKNLRTFQTIMGEIQDYRVLMDTLRDFIKLQNEITDDAFKPVTEELEKRKKDLVNEFLNKSDIIYSYWKPKE